MSDDNRFHLGVPEWSTVPRFDDQAIIAARPARNLVSPWQPYHSLVEDERTADGTVEPVGTIFLTNRECPFHCLMCDLWKNTLTERVPTGAIPAQIDAALAALPPVRHVKLYNSGNFFDAQAIPPEDHAAIASRLHGMRTVIVENHPRLCGDVCGEFAARLPGEL
ncbi:MAG: radical SAM protein, partial [Planctomycetaceae bacterium]|nr:radical SAM protein [Planctomycetaceae bacterium]